MTKTNNIFNYMLIDPENIDEKTIYENTGVKVENVKRLVMNKIHESKSAPKKNKGKIIRFTLIAVAAAAVLGTSVASATGTFNPVFGKLFAGEAPNGAYTGGSVKANSNDLNIEFDGVLGDANNAYSMMTITKKDGSAIVEDSKNVMMVTSFDEREEYDPAVTISHSLIDDVFGTKTEHRGSLFYSFENDNTLKVIIAVYENKNLIGSTMNINEDKVIVWREDEVIYTPEDIRNMSKEFEKDDYVEDGLTWMERAEKEYTKKIGHALAENQAVMPGYNANGYIIDEDGLLHNMVVAHYDIVDLDYDMSVKLNYKDTSVSFENMIGKEITIDGQKQNITAFEVTPFSMTIKTEFEDINYDFLEDEELVGETSDFYRFSINLENGKTYHTTNSGAGLGLISGTDDKFESEFRYTQFYDSEEKVSIINPSKIVSITYKGNTLYSK